MPVDATNMEISLKQAYAIETDSLTKYYGDFEAVRGLTMRVPKGTITGFLGQNGAGKSSTIRMLLGMSRPTRGNGRVLDLDIADERQSIEMRKRVAYVAEDKRLYDYMTVRQMIDFTKAFFPGWRTEIEQKLLDDFRLPLDRSTKKLSKGMRTQLALLLAFARGAELLILDEPTEGLDPVMAEKTLELVVGAAAEGATIFFSSHQIAEVEQIADRILLIDRGQLLLDTTLDSISTDFRRIRGVYDTAPKPAALALDGVKRIAVDGRTVSVMVSHNSVTIAERMRAESASAVEVLPMTLKEIVLESLKRDQP
ncbi:MAG TPA: ABC transporter ATP-binding protein [Gemmatimonadaceae bacterium]|nr:ABC transporter ATP-binding protein [Gemmatimonadaceae bacterium]